MDLGFLDVRLNRIETPVAGPVQRKKTLLIGSTDKDALAAAILRELIITNLN